MSYPPRLQKTRRIQRIWPFFALLCTIELLFDHSLKALYEWIADLSLVFGLIPGNGIEIVGVGWFVGTIFVFYMIFPFYTFLIRSTKRAWIVMATALILHTVCRLHFLGAAGRSNIIFSSIFFVAGGLIYLYREKLNKKVGLIALALTVVTIVFFFIVNNSEYTMLVLFSSIAIAALACGGGISKAILQNRIISFIGKLSMEIYLCHMFVYRVLERIHLNSATDNAGINYIVMSMTTILGAITFAFIWSFLYGKISNRYLKKRIAE